MTTHHHVPHHNVPTVHNVATVTVHVETRDEAVTKSQKAFEQYFSDNGYKIISTVAEVNTETGFVARWTVRVTAESD